MGKAVKTQKSASEKPKTDLEKSEKTPYPFPKERYYCSFCRKSGDDVWRMIAGPNHIFICDTCIEVCTAILLSDEVDETNVHWWQRLTHLMANPKKFVIPDEDKSKSKKKDGAS